MNWNSMWRIFFHIILKYSWEKGLQWKEDHCCSCSLDWAWQFAYNPSTQDTWSGQLWVRGQPEPHNGETCLSWTSLLIHSDNGAVERYICSHRPISGFWKVKNLSPTQKRSGNLGKGVTVSSTESGRRGWEAGAGAREGAGARAGAGRLWVWVQPAVHSELQAS